MSVLCEAISVVVPQRVLAEKYPGGGQAHRRHCPDRSYCTDGTLARVGFNGPAQVERYVADLTDRGLRLADTRGFRDLAVIDQFTGLTMPCDWLEWRREGRVTRAWLAGTEPGELAVPDDWEPATAPPWETGSHTG